MEGFKRACSMIIVCEDSEQFVQLGCANGVRKPAANGVREHKPEQRRGGAALPHSPCGCKSSALPCMVNSILDLGVPSHHDGYEVGGKLQIALPLILEFPGDPIKGLGKVQRHHEATKERSIFTPLMLVMQVFMVSAELCPSSSTMGKCFAKGVILGPSTLVGSLGEVGNLIKYVRNVGIKDAAQHFLP